ncbi:MAG: hypothetical protein ACYC0X_20060 [Pirellulaceae bacterium]
MAITTVRLVVSMFVFAFVNHAVPLFAQQSERTTEPATVNTEDLRPGMWCRVTLETPPQSDLSHQIVYQGKIQEITKDEIVLVTTISESRIEHKVPILWQIPYVGRWFIKTGAALEEIACRTPLAKIAAIECRGSTKEDGDTDSLERIGVDFK